MSERTDIIISNIPELYNQSGAVLKALTKSKREVYQIEGVISRIRHIESGARIEPLTQDGLRYEISQSVCCLKRKTYADGREVLFEVDPPMGVVRDALASAEIPLPPIAGIVSHPLISENGKIIYCAGYNPDTLFYVAAPEEILKAARGVPIAPNVAEVSEAVALIGEVAIDIPFATEADRANYFAAFLTMLNRPLIKGPTPIILIESSTQGTGKTLTGESIIKINTGRPAVPTAWSSDEEELKKTIHSMLISGNEYIFIDNVNGKIGSGTLASVVTSGSLNSRILGFSKMVSAPCNAIIIITANNPDVSREIARRCVPIKLVTDLENPAERTGFKHPDLDSFIMENRAELIKAGLVMIRAWFANECDTSGVKVLGSFEAWSRTIGGILKSCGIKGFLENTADFFSLSDGDAENWGAFLGAWYKEHTNSPVMVRDILPLAREYGLVDEKRPEGSQKKSLGRVMLKKRDVVFGGIKVTRASFRSGNLTWKAIKTEGGEQK